MIRIGWEKGMVRFPLLSFFLFQFDRGRGGFPFSTWKTEEYTGNHRFVCADTKYKPLHTQPGLYMRSELFHSLDSFLSLIRSQQSTLLNIACSTQSSLFLKHWNGQKLVVLECVSVSCVKVRTCQPWNCLLSFTYWLFLDKLVFSYIELF